MQSLYSVYSVVLLVWILGEFTYNSPLSKRKFSKIIFVFQSYMLYAIGLLHHGLCVPGKEVRLMSYTKQIAFIGVKSLKREREKQIGMYIDKKSLRC